MQTKVADDLNVDSLNILETGNYGPVFTGEWKTELLPSGPVAVKRTQSVSQHIEDLVRSLEHENVVKLLHVKRQDTEPFEKYSSIQS